ncbi:TetR/AcrR family transcriptional regulator [Massilia sp. SM-13]|uniref:TetR/AcrR family transcriptional regulator n=1 Tax=Pseudoduganella rhizocola TaxID=3382643 RepID=UPI0038B543FC
MNKPRGRPVRGDGMTRGQILDAALLLLEEGQGLSMRALATRLNVTPMSLYHHVSDHAGLLRAISDRVYAAVLAADAADEDPATRIRTLLVRYHGAVKDYPQLTLAIFAQPAAFAGTTRDITDRLIALLGMLTKEAVLWLEILVDHAHGNALAFHALRDHPQQAASMQSRYLEALDQLLARLA